MLKPPSQVALLCLLLLLPGCERDGLTTAEVQEAAKERVRQQLGLSREAALFTNVFVGEPVNGDVAVCGTVEGRKSDGTAITPRRFIAGTDPARWVLFEPAAGVDLPSRPDMFVEWHSACRGEEEVR